MAIRNHNGEGIPPKKLIPLYIVRVLKDHDSGRSALSAAAVSEYLMYDFGLKLDRKTVEANLALLADNPNCLGLGERVRFSTKTRKFTDALGESEQEVRTGWYCEVDAGFELSEARYLVDVLNSDNRMPHKQKQDLFEKIKHMSGVRELAGLGDFYDAAPDPLVTPHISWTIEVLSEALRNGYCVQFRLGARDLKGKLRLGTEDGGSKLNVVDPLFLAMSQGHYYLVACYEGGEKTYHFRVDLMLEVDFFRDEVGECVLATRGSLSKPDVLKYIRQHLYMYTDTSQKIVFRIPDTSIARHQVFDFFGLLAFMSKAKGKPGYLDVSVEANLTAMRYWALQYSDLVEVLKPQSLRSDLHAAAQALVKKYEALP